MKKQNKTKQIDTLRMASRTRVACVVVFVIDIPLKKVLRVLVLMAAPNLDLMARELEMTINS
jgi:hypothetical protein